MPCYKPLEAYRPSATGSKKLVFSYHPKTCASRTPIMIPCGQCVGCRLERSRQWAVRCVNESQMHSENAFITLTYDPAKLPDRPAGVAPADISLYYPDFQKFMKRLRFHFPDKKISYYMCGEYGENFGRPHFHACLFGIDFIDRVPWKKTGKQTLYRSKILESLWPYGYSSVGTVTFESAAYVARYIMKKITGEAAEQHYSFCRSFNRGNIKPPTRVYPYVSEKTYREIMASKVHE